jgi:nucleotide-binding universal stress UspA family protein
MLKVRRILCPTDFSEFAKGALEQAIVLGRRYDAEIVSACVIPTLMPPTAGLPFALPPHFDAQARKATLDELGRFTEPCRLAGLKTRLEVLEGGVASSVVELAQLLPADLIVMGTHGSSGFERLMLGSVTEKVLRRAHCPVLTVPRRAHDEARTPHAWFKSILCPVDFAESSEWALGYALSLARESSARVLLVHVLEDSSDGGVRDASRWTVPEYRRALERGAKECLTQILAPMNQTGCVVEQVLSSGKPGAEILRVAERRACDLVVMGSHGGTLETALFGSTAQHVVRGAACPVVTVRSESRYLGSASGF